MTTYNSTQLTTIREDTYNKPKYKTFKYQLRKLKLLYLEQLCTANNTTLLT